MLLNNLSIAFLSNLPSTPSTAQEDKSKVTPFIFHQRPTAKKFGSGCGNGHLRAEYSSEDHYNSGVHQFTGKFTINSFKGDRISLNQTLGNKGAWFMLAADKSGNLYGVGGRGMIAQGVAKVGATVTVNTIHDADTGLYKVYINGQEKYSTTSPQDEWRDKYGAYATSSGSGPITVTWNDVEFYTR
ncbi:hypothetical protein ACKLNR_003591 [Fusarium oxysporum f. sp. zingiberi]